MTFLEFVVRKLLGPPPWHCPFHEDRNPSFTVRPPKPGHRVRFKCWGCQAWGDELDLLKHFFPNDDYSARLERVASLRKEWEATGDCESSDVLPQGMWSGENHNTDQAPGVQLIYSLIKSGAIVAADVEEVQADFNVQRMLEGERERMRAYKQSQST